MSRELLTPTEASELLRISRTTLWRLVRDGKLVPYVVRSRKRFLMSDLRKLRVQPPPPRS